MALPPPQGLKLNIKEETKFELEEFIRKKSIFL